MHAKKNGGLSNIRSYLKIYKHTKNLGHVPEELGTMSASACGPGCSYLQR